MAVNLSTRKLLDAGLADQLGQLLRRWGSTLAPRRTRGALSRLKETGVALSIDDFGAGYSSLGYLKDLPVVEIDNPWRWRASRATRR